MQPATVASFCLLCLSCAAPREPTTPERSVAPASTTATSSPEQPPPRTAKPKGRVHAGAVDDIVVGAPIPARYLEGTPRYHARWVADAQPMEGFLIGDPPIWVSIADGPMEHADPSRDFDELKRELAPKALVAARAGKRVEGILIEHPGITTDEGVGVGSSFEAVQEAYGQMTVLADPELFDSKPNCNARPKNFPSVRFIFASCPNGGPVGAVRLMYVGAP